MDETAARWRSLLLETIEPYADLPLLLSGGMDSATLLAASLTLGCRPTCYSFRLGDADSEDVATARRVCRAYDLEHVVVSLDSSLDALWAELPDVIERIGTARKAAVQCAQPLLHLARRIRSDGHERVILGTGGVVEDNRELSFMLRREGEEATREYRRRNLYEWNGSGNATEAMHVVIRSERVGTVEPYALEPLAAYALSLDVAELNRPGRKGIARRAFPAFYADRRRRRANSPLQVNAGLREWHDGLLYSPYNTIAATSVVQLYRLIAEDPESARSVQLGMDAL